MAVVSTRAGRIGNRLAIAAVIVLTLVFLSPIYWITSTAFKPLVLATSVPPTVVFEPEVTPFVKLFVKRAQLTAPVDQETYDAAPWWEKLVLGGGERLSRDGNGDVVFSPYPDRFINSLIIAISSTILAVSMGTITAYGFSRFRVKGEADLLFFILSTRMMPPIAVLRGRHRFRLLVRAARAASRSPPTSPRSARGTPAACCCCWPAPTATRDSAARAAWSGSCAPAAGGGSAG